MRGRRGIVVAMVVLGAAILPAQPPARPVVSLSLTTPPILKVARDSVDLVIQWTSACMTATTCPTRHRVVLAGEWIPPVAMRTAQTVRRVVVRVGKPVCPQTLRLRVAVAAEQGSVVGPATPANITVRCRALNVVERAHLDSFPKENHRITLCSKYGQRLSPDEWMEFRAFNLARAKTAQDSGRVHNEWEAIRLGPDSVYTPQADPDTIHMLLGRKYPMAMLLKNRYTGRVRTEDGVQWSTSNPDIVQISPGSNSCQAMIAAWEAERDS